MDMAKVPETLIVGPATIYECAYNSPLFARLLRDCKCEKPHVCPRDHAGGDAAKPLESRKVYSESPSGV